MLLNKQAETAKAEISDELVIPERVQLESSFGCNASCTMCPVDMPTNRKKGIMKMDVFEKFVDSMKPYADRIEKFDLWGLGEPLMDKKLWDKIKYAKAAGFKNLAIATNADMLTSESISKLLASGLETVILSIDGVTAETHDFIRKGVSLSNIVPLVEEMINRRDEGNYKTKFVVRFIRQERNKHEWEDYKDFWSARISKDRGDILIGYDMHSWGGEIDLNEGEELERIPDDVPCHHLFDRLMVLQDGTVPLCCSDLHHSEYSLGHILEDDPIEIFNNEKINHYRALHLQGKRRSMKICDECTILESEQAQRVT